MVDKINWIWGRLQGAFAIIGGWIGYFVGGWDGMLITLVVFMVIDYITGVSCAIIDKNLSSSIGFKGIFKKILILMMVGIAHIIDTYVVRSGSAIRAAVICFYLSNEGVSILENAAHIGLPIPDKLKEILEQIHGRSEEKKEAEDDVPN